MDVPTYIVIPHTRGARVIRIPQTASENPLTSDEQTMIEMHQELTTLRSATVETVTEQRDVLRYLLKQIFDHMPAKRDWLDPFIEKAAKHGMKELPTIRDLYQDLAAESERVRVLTAAINDCIDHAGGRESEWGDQAETAFGYLYNAIGYPPAPVNPLVAISRKEGSG